MSKYYLVGSYYDKNKHEYLNEFVISEIKGEELSTLKEIDMFTSINSQFELFNLIRNEYVGKEFNTLSVMYLKTNNSNPVYLNVISNDELYNECVKGASYVKKNINGVYRNSLFVNVNSKLYKQEVSKLLELISGNDFEKFEEFYPYKNDLRAFVWRYMNASYDSELDKERDLQLVLLEFSRYKTFRGWYVEEGKKSKKKVGNVNKGTPVNKSRKSEVLSIEEYESEYEKEFTLKNNVSIEGYKTSQYNEEYEEFLDEDESLEMFDYENSRVKRRH